MSHQLTNQLTAGRKLLLALAGIAAIAGPLVFGLINSPQGRAQSTPAAAPTAKFEVVSIKPNPENNGRTMIRLAPGGRFEAHNITTKFLLEEAYGVKESQLLGLPGWAGSESYDVDAKPEEPAADSKMDREQMQAQFGQMLQAMLAERFKLTLHHDTKELSVYALEVAKNGPKFHETTAPDVDPASLPDGPPKPGAVVGRGNIGMMGRGNLTVSGVAMPRFADVLSRQLGRIVVDKTGLKGDYDFTLKWTPDEGEGMFKGAGGPPKDSAPPPDASGPSIFTALQEQLGLKLESQKTPVDVLVIDHIERPSQN